MVRQVILHSQYHQFLESTQRSRLDILDGVVTQIEALNIGAAVGNTAEVPR